MIDIIGGISLTALFALCCAVLITAVPVGAAARSRLAAVAVAWFASVGTLAATGTFAAAGTGTPAIAAAILAPIALSLFAAARSSTVRTIALDTPLAALVAVHAGRLLGVFFLLLFDAGRLPQTFATIAGWGDIGVALAALPLAWAIHRRMSGWQTLTFSWNLLAFADLATAVTLGIGSAPDSPVRFIYDDSSTDTIASLPWMVIPGVLVPLFLLTHLAIFAQLVRHRVTRPDRGHGGGVILDGVAG